MGIKKFTGALFPALDGLAIGMKDARGTSGRDERCGCSDEEIGGGPPVNVGGGPMLNVGGGPFDDIGGSFMALRLSDDMRLYEA